MSTPPTTWTAVPTATATCPGTAIVLAGSTTTEVAALASAISTWSDGATVAIWQKLGTAFHAALVGTSTNAVTLYAMGVAATNTAGANGAYIVKSSYAITSSALDASGNTTGNAVKYMNAAGITSDGFDYAAAAAGTAFSSSAADKYGMTLANSGWSGAAVAVDSTLSNLFYLPKEPATIPTGETDSTGDRWNTADVVAGFIGTGSSDANAEPTTTSCITATAGVLTLGAAQLAAAGAAAFAAAMAF